MLSSQWIVLNYTIKYIIDRIWFSKAHNTVYEIKLIIIFVPHVSLVTSIIFSPWTLCCSSAISVPLLLKLAFVLPHSSMYFYNICCTFLALILCLFTDNLFLWLAVGVETHSWPSAAWLPWCFRSCCFCSIDLNVKWKNQYYYQAEKKSTLRWNNFFLSLVILRKIYLIKGKYTYNKIMNVVHTYTHLFYISLVDSHWELCKKMV